MNRQGCGSDNCGSIPRVWEITDTTTDAATAPTAPTGTEVSVETNRPMAPSPRSETLT
ncbi:hypothetical protein [Mycetocola sp.]|uniref:hypothetical protein n=1 Tax=Mycetocola sp. TaxID=1871042 RepID=UPI0026348197|nr:hypothetical protein [Mycetocola sp.]